MRKLTTTAILLAGLSMTAAEAAPSLKDCDRIFQQGARQNQIADNVRAKAYAVSGAAAQCAFGRESMSQLERIVAEKRAIRSNSCWTSADEARFQRILLVQKNFVRSTAAACFAARNPGAVPFRSPVSRTLTRD